MAKHKYGFVSNAPHYAVRSAACGLLVPQVLAANSGLAHAGVAASLLNCNVGNDRGWILGSLTQP
jgi:hypothetical protein